MSLTVLIYQDHHLVADMGGWVQYLLTALMAGPYLTRLLFTQDKGKALLLMLLLKNNYVGKIS